MPKTLLYTIIVEQPVRESDILLEVTFQLSDIAFKEALDEKSDKEKKRAQQYHLGLMENVPKEDEAYPEYAIYIGEKDYFIYEKGKARQLITFSDKTSLKMLDSRTQKTLNQDKISILETLLGPPKNCLSYIDAYQASHFIDHFYFKGWLEKPPLREKIKITVQGPDNISRDKALNILPVIQTSNSKKSSHEAYRYVVSEENGQCTLNMEVPKAANPIVSMAGLITLKKYAKNLLLMLDIKKTDQSRYPKIDITGQGANELYTRKSPEFYNGMGRAGLGVFIGALGSSFMFLAIVALAANPIGITSFFIVVASLALIASVVSIGYGIKDMIRAPYKDLAWHQKELAENYEHYFKNRPVVGVKPESTAPIFTPEAPAQAINTTSSEKAPEWPDGGTPKKTR